jgi:GntR family transcriptional regulator/MocR family aminotransferase
MAMSMARRQALIEWAERRDAVLVEDDYDSEFRYGGRPLEPLQGFDRFGRVLYLGSFSKVMFPTLRLGFLVAPPPLHAALRKARFVTDWHTVVPVQAATALFIDDGLLAQHLRRMRRVYAERHELVRSLLTRDFAGCLTPLPSAGGLHLTAVLAEGLGGVDDCTLAERASAVGVAVFPLSRNYASRPARQGLLFGYGAIAAERIEEGLRRLRQCF